MTAIRNNISPLTSNTDTSEALRQWAQDNKAMLDVLLDAYCIVDLANKVVDFNVAFTELCGESYRKVLKIAHFCELVKTEICPGQCPAIQITTTQKPVRLDELSGTSKAYQNLQMIISGAPVFNAAGEILGAFLTIRNVSAEHALQKKYGESKLMSVTDGLTRLYNKTYSETYLLRAVKSALREIQAISVVMVDVDHFKKVNDNFGHQAGDYVLAQVAQLLRAEVRDSDTVGRFGGEEFIVILANCDTGGAKIFAERYRKRIESTPFTFDGKEIPVTISLGTATFSDNWIPGMNPESSVKDIVAKADAALYYAKKNGRNQSQQAEFLPKDAAKNPKR